MKKLKSQNGAIAIIVLVSVLFLTMFLISSYMVISNKLKTQKEVIDQTRQIYENYDLAEIYNSFFNNGAIPIYSNNEYLSVGKNEKIIIPELGGKYYEFTDSANYILMNDLVINVQDYPDFDWENWQAPEYYFENNDLDGKIDYNGHIVTIIRAEGTKEEYGGTVIRDPSSVTGKWAKLWETTENSDGTLAITDYLYSNEELQVELRKTEAELLDNVTVPNKINGKVVSTLNGAFRIDYNTSYPFTGTFTISDNITVTHYNNATGLLFNCDSINKVVLGNGIKFTENNGYYIFAMCDNLDTIEMGNDCYAVATIFREDPELKTILMGNNCELKNPGAFTKSGTETIDIKCGENTSIYLDNIASTTKNIDTTNATFNYLYGDSLTIKGDLIINENAYVYCNKSTVSGNLEAKDNAQVRLAGNKVAGITLLGNNLSLLGESSFYNFSCPEIRISSTLTTTTKYAQFYNCKTLPTKIELNSTSEGMGSYCFGSTDIEYLTINPYKDFKVKDAIFYQCNNVKAVIVNLSEQWAKGNFLASIGGNVHSEWLGRMATETFYSTPIDDAENNRLIYYSTNLTKDESEVLKLISEAGL